MLCFLDITVIVITSTSHHPPSRALSSSRCNSVELSSQASRSSSVELLSQPSSSKLKESLQASKMKRKRDDQEVDDLLIKNLKALEEPTKLEDEEELFGWQMAIILRRFTARQRAHAKLKIQSLLVEIEFPDVRTGKVSSNRSVF